jgi:saccharopine dehydrogenase (NAD+, L-lysine-forming)
MRYPGHAQLMNFFFHELLMRDHRGWAGQILTNAKPPVDDDVVYVHVACEGTLDGRLRRLEHVRSFRPRRVAGVDATAIAWTTAGSVASVIELVRDGTLPAQGFLKQEAIPFSAFLGTPTGTLFS